MLCSDLPASHGVKAVWNDLSEQHEFNLQVLTSALKQYLLTSYPRLYQKLILSTVNASVDYFHTQSTFKKGDQDGAKFSKSSNFIILSFSLPVLKSKVSSGAGNNYFTRVENIRTGVLQHREPQYSYYQRGELSHSHQSLARSTSSLNGGMFQRQGAFT